MRTRTVLVPLVASAALLLAACSSGDSASPSPAAASVSASPSASASASASATPTATASASATPTPTPSGPNIGQVIRPSMMGMHVAGVQDGAWPDSNVPLGALRLWDNGTNWSQVEAVPGTFNWKALDGAVRTAEANGVDDILLVLGGTPTWAAATVTPTDYPVPGAASPPKSLDDWDDFVTAVVERYKGRISAYQIWNEASLAMFYNGRPEKLADMTKRAYDIIKRTDPKATVVAASTTLRLTGAFDRFFPRYLAGLAENDWPVDVFAAHLYPASKGTTDERAAFIDLVHAALDQAGAPDLPVWDTELNYGLAGPGPENPRQTIEGAKARDWVVQTAMDSLHLGIDRTYWYIWTPEPYELLGMQLTNDSGAVKGMRVVDQWVVGATWLGCTDDGAVIACTVDRKGVPSVIAWAKDGTASFTAPSTVTQACGTNNKCVPVAETGPTEVTETPTRFVP